MVSTPFKNISQIGNLPQVGVKIKNIRNHHLAKKRLLLLLPSCPKFLGMSLASGSKCIFFKGAIGERSALPKKWAKLRMMPGNSEAVFFLPQLFKKDIVDMGVSKNRPTLRIIGPTKLAILRTLPLVYRFKPSHWRVQDASGTPKWMVYNGKPSLVNG